MKNYIFLILALTLASFARAQFSESFFDRLGPYTDTQGKHYFGTAIPNGALAVRFADSSLNTQVQWVKLDLQGNTEFFSAQLPGGTIHPTEKIIEVFASGTNQFIVTQDSLSTSPEGIRIYKFQNYVDNLGALTVPAQLVKGNYQSYLKYGKIYLFYAEEGGLLKSVRINPQTMTIEQNLVLASNFNYGAFQNFKKIHVLFENAASMQVFTSSTTNLIRIKVENSVVAPLETTALNLRRVLGIDSVNNRLICYSADPDGSYNLRRYIIDADQPLSNIAEANGLILPENGLHNWIYATDGVHETLISEITAQKMIEIKISTNTIEQSADLDEELLVTQVEYLNGKPIVFGRRTAETVNFEGTSSWVLFVSWGSPDQAMNFQEYGGIYPFGAYNTRFGTGSSIMSPATYPGDGYIFSKMIYGLTQHYVGKSNGQLRGMTSGLVNERYKPGPYTNQNAYSQQIVDKFNENFYIDQSMVSQHVDAIANNTPGYVVPDAILNWPAHGDVPKGQAANLAPFIDLNNNSIYEPLLGEYPTFPGTRCMLNISHQHENDFGGNGTGLELHTYLYNFDCNDTIKEVLFTKTIVYNRGSIQYDSLEAGYCADFDLGSPSDDYIGTNVENGMVYAYNSDPNDEDFAGNTGFHDILPTIGQIYLKGVKIASNNTDDAPGVGPFQTVNGFGFDDGTIDNEYFGLQHSMYYISPPIHIPSNPLTSEDWFNVLHGNWLEGDTLFFGGYGNENLTGATDIPSRYAFPGDSDPLNYGTGGIVPPFTWSEDSPSIWPEDLGLVEGDRRVTGSFGSTSLFPNRYVTYHSAILAGKGISGAGMSQADLFARAKHVREAFNNNETSCGQTFDNPEPEMVTGVKEIENASFVKVYPNPFSAEINIAVPNPGLHTELRILDLSGKVLLQRTLNESITTINLSGYESGIYFIQVQTDSKTDTKKIVKK